MQLLAKNFAAMQRLGDPVLKPFLQVCRPALFNPLLHVRTLQLVHGPREGFVPKYWLCVMTQGVWASVNNISKGFMHKSIITP